MSPRLVLLLALVAVLVAGAVSHDSKHKTPDRGQHGKSGGNPKHDSHEGKEHTKPKPKPKPGHGAKPHHGPGHGPKPHHGPNVGPGHGPKPHHGPNVSISPGDGAKPHHRPSPGVPVDGPGACHVCYANSSLRLVAPESNCTRYFSQSLLHPHLSTLNVCPKGQTFNAGVCACSAVSDRPCTCSARGGGSAVTQKPSSWPTLATPASHLTTSSSKRECSCRRGESRYVPDWSTGCRSYVEESGNNRIKKHSCPNNQLFSIDKCSCERADKANCSCAVPATPSPLPLPEKTFCSLGDYVYRPVPRSACKNFTIEAAFLKPIMFACPVHFVFHVSTCSCILAAHLTDHAQCHDHHGGIGTTQPSNRTATPTSTTLAPSNSCHCVRNGVTYRPVSDCRSFLQSANTTAARQLDCPAGLLFSVDWCVCDRAENVRCRAGCSAPEPSQPPRHAAECHACRAGGNVYRQIPDTGCRKFSHASATSVTVVNSCPGNQLFDPKACVCNHAEAVRCTCSSNQTFAAAASHAPGAAAGSVSWPASLDRAHQGSEKSGCSCIAQGNLYRPVDDCRAFTQASVTTPNAIARHSCPAGLVFNTAKCICDWPRSTACHDCPGLPHASRPK